MHEYPKWVVPHDTHVVRQGDHVSTPHFPGVHVARDSAVSVLVHDAAEEAFALAAPEPEDAHAEEAVHEEPPADVE